MAGRSDIRQMVGAIVNFAKSKANDVCTAPCDGLVLRMHYRWTFYILIGGFFTVWYSWFYKDIITCVSHFNAETQVRMDYINICLSYPFIQYEDKSRRYLMFYRWIHWIFMLLAAVYYIPRKLSKNIENDKFKTLLEDIAQQSGRYDHVEKQVSQCVVMYISNNFHTHNGLYIKYLGLNVLALLIDIFTLYFLDFALNGNFIRYGFNSYPFERDPRHFSDYMSVTFPPFASCELDKDNQLTASRKETLGCHLTLMELYEKLFLYIWLWLIILMTITSLYIVFVLLMLIPAFRQFILRPSKPAFGEIDVKNIIHGLNKICKIGDIYFLYRVKQYISHARFYELIYRMSREKFWEPSPMQTHIDANPDSGKKSTAKQRGNARPPGFIQPVGPPVVLNYDQLHRQL